ncbi:hypothetical protein QMZ93_20115 [Pantoea stewartii subsp. indologenes]|uniref:hypothetical protein n=1 Tax=Pantoea stewartii TaxID=66269 RepID=UPI001CF7A134|nr:hypothetical protein [Pantoea stewartii]MDK2635642.1 hypothetical protein [Pantoea stewartii subsp. indologenes]
MDTSFLNALDTKNREQFDAAINALQGDVTAAAARLSIDPRCALSILSVSKRWLTIYDPELMLDC